MSDLQINELCRAFVCGATIETIAEVENMSVEDVKTILTDNTDTVQELKKFYKTMEAEV